MKLEVLTGPREYGLRMVREPGDGLAWDVMVHNLRAWSIAAEEARDAEVARLLGEWRA